MLKEVKRRTMLKDYVRLLFKTTFNYVKRRTINDFLLPEHLITQMILSTKTWDGEPQTPDLPFWW